MAPSPITVIRGASQMLTMAVDGGQSPQEQQRAIGVIADATLVCEEGRIAWLGPSNEAPSPPAEATVVDARGCVVMPGFVDAHTHLIHAGDRAAEFVERAKGATYLDILARGGGILSTVRATRAASDEQLHARGLRVLGGMLRHGTTTVEAKTGYGLDIKTELRCLDVVHRLRREQPVEIVSTWLGAHATPPEFAGDTDGYVDYMAEQVLPAVLARGHADLADVFCEQGVFTVEQTRRLMRAAMAAGLGVVLHADEIAESGAAALAAELGALSASHLCYASDEGLRAMRDAGVAAVLLPTTSFALRHGYANGRAMADMGLRVALASDFNPGTSPTYGMPFAITLACLRQGLTPEEALVAATRNAARAIGIGDRVGALAVGMQADCLVLDVADYVSLPYRFGVNPVLTVVKRGQVVWDGRGLARSTRGEDKPEAG